MISELLERSSLFSLLHRIDRDLAEEHRQKRCPVCGGPLHQSNYPRKPRGGPEDLPEEILVRRSFCCGTEGCRVRSLPPSCLFMGRRVYWGVVILVVMTLRQGRPEGRSTIWLQRRFGVSRKTLFRWIAYFRDSFPHQASWKRIRGRVRASIKDRDLPGGLVEWFLEQVEGAEHALAGCLRFLATGQGSFYQAL